MNKGTVRICSWCQKEYPEVDKQVHAHEKNFMFTHGICKRHLIASFKELENFYSSQKINAMIAKLDFDNTLPADLSQNPELVKAYSQGNFTPLKERFQKLANIHKNTD